MIILRLRMVSLSFSLFLLSIPSLCSYDCIFSLFALIDLSYSDDGDDGDAVFQRPLRIKTNGIYLTKTYRNEANDEIKIFPHKIEIEKWRNDFEWSVPWLMVHRRRH